MLINGHGFSFGSSGNITVNNGPFRAKYLSINHALSDNTVDSEGPGQDLLNRIDIARVVAFTLMVLSLCFRARA